jgi:hypothetical protein
VRAYTIEALTGRTGIPTTICDTPAARWRCPLPVAVTAQATRQPTGTAAGPQSAVRRCQSAVVGSMIDFTSEMRLAGKPPFSACSRTMPSFGAMYTQ